MDGLSGWMFEMTTVVQVNDENNTKVERLDGSDRLEMTAQWFCILRNQVPTM